MNWKSQPSTFQGFHIYAESKPLGNPYYLIIHLKTCHNKKLSNNKAPFATYKKPNTLITEEKFKML